MITTYRKEARMIDWEEKRKLVKIANWYYNDNLTQEQIAEKLSVSRPIISKSLQKAKDIGIIKIYIDEKTVHTVEMENILSAEFNLKDVVITPISDKLTRNLLQSVGKAGANYLLNNIKNIKNLGISWGETLTALVEEYPYDKRKNLKIVPLEGGMGQSRIEIHANQLAYKLAEKTGGTCHYLYAPAVVETENLRNRLIQLEDLNTVLAEGKSVDTALIGLGNPFQKSTLKAIGYLNDSEREQLKKTGVAGDMGFRFFDKKGSPCLDLLNKKVIGISLSDLEKIDNVIAIVAGVHKAESILAALHGGFIDVLITDELTAEELLNRKQ